MLVLSRKVDEGLRVPDCNMTIRILKSARGVVRLGIEAPRSLRIVREELGDSPPPEEPPAAETPPPQLLFHDAAERRLKSVEVGLEMLRKEVEDGNHELVHSLVESLQNEMREIRELKNLAGKSDAVQGQKSRSNQHRSHAETDEWREAPDCDTAVVHDGTESASVVASQHPRHRAR